MKRLLVILIASFSFGVVYAADDCAAQATEKKLAGAAKSSFMKKCTADSMPPAQATCEATAKEKKLAGAAKNSFVKKCLSDAGAAK
jgi:hypothetical protein